MHDSDAAAYARCFTRWSECAYREVARVHQVGLLQPSNRRRRRGRRPWPPLPLLQIVVEPGESIDFADPLTGFPGCGQEPSPDRVLTLWADNLLSVSHGNDWIYLIDAEHPFQRAWLDLLVPPLGATYAFWHAVVSASFAGPTPPGRFRMADVDATSYLTRVHIEDRRGEGGVASRTATAAGRRRGGSR